MTVRDALNSALDEEMSADPNIFLLGEEVGEYQGAYKITKGLLDKYGPERVRDTPITEAGFTGIAVGAAYHGLRLVVEFMTFNFSIQMSDVYLFWVSQPHYQLCCKIELHVCWSNLCTNCFRGPNGAAAGVGAQHSQCYAAWFGACPGLKVLSPFSSEDVRGLLKVAIRDPDLVVFLENELLFKVQVKVMDDTSSASFVLFDREAQQVIGKSAYELREQLIKGESMLDVVNCVTPISKRTIHSISDDDVQGSQSTDVEMSTNKMQKNIKIEKDDNFTASN